jgi:diacylglycerol kinase family enzyme
VITVPVILNPIAGGGRLLGGRGRLGAVASASGFKLDFWIAEDAAHTVALAQAAAEEERPLVLAFGGDGTYNAIAKALLGSATAMGVLPGGTTSVLAYEFGVPRPARRSVEALLRGEDRLMRVGRTDKGDIILLMLSTGPDAMVLERLRPSFKKLGGRAGVALQAVVEAAVGGSLPRVRVASGAAKGEVGWVIVGKSRSYGSKFHATPGSDPFRADLEVVALRSSRRRAVISFLCGIPSGRHVARNDVVREIVDRVRLEPAVSKDAVPYQIDGDVVGTLPVEITIHPEALLVRLPAPA